MQTIALTHAREALLMRPSLIDVRAAALRILQQRGQCQPGQAEWELQSLRAGNMIRDLFKRLMPKEFKKADAVGGSGMIAAFEVACGFPLNTDWMIEMLETAEFEIARPEDLSIPIYSLCVFNADDWYDLADVPAEWQLALLLNRPRDLHRSLEQGENENWALMARAYGLGDSLRPAGYFKPEVFAEVFLSHRSPLRHLPLLVSMVQFNTGCVFYDYNYNDGDPDIEWNVENIKWLREQAKIAKPMGRAVRQLAKWMEFNTSEKVAQACRLYQKAQRLSNAKANPKADQGRALVGIL